MFKAIKVLVLLAIVACGGIAIYYWNQSAKQERTGAAAQIGSKSGEKGEKGVRVEEKYGFTSEGAGGP